MHLFLCEAARKGEMENIAAKSCGCYLDIFDWACYTNLAWRECLQISCYIFPLEILVAAIFKVNMELWKKKINVCIRQLSF